MQVDRGEIRVGTCKWIKGKRVDPTFPGFTNIVVLTKSSEYGMLGPYVLADTKGRIMENIWQASKTYEVVNEACEVRSRYDRTVIWKWPSQIHAVLEHNDKGPYWRITSEYLQWRKALSECKEPVRYPVGKDNMHKCLFAMSENEDGSINPKILNYIESRKEIYIKVYRDLVKKQDEFIRLKHRLDNGENLLIIEVDGPRERSLNYYKQIYDVENDFIEKDTMLITEKNLDIMLNDTKERFGHGYCLAGSLIDIY